MATYSHNGVSPDGRLSTSGGRAVTVFMALGAFAVLVGADYLLPFALSQNAMQNDMYMPNLFGGVAFLVAGSVSLLVGLLGLAIVHMRGRAAL